MGNIVMPLLQRTAPLPRRTESILQAQGLQSVLPMSTDLDNVSKFRHIKWLAERSQRHHLVFVGAVQKTQVTGQVRVEQAERVRQIDLSDPLQPVALADVVRRG